MKKIIIIIRGTTFHCYLKILRNNSRKSRYKTLYKIDSKMIYKPWVAWRDSPEGNE